MLDAGDGDDDGNIDSGLMLRSKDGFLIWEYLAGMTSNSCPGYSQAMAK